MKDLSQKIKEVGEIKDGVRTYAGDDSGDNPLKRKNSEAMELRGGADSDNLSDNNIGVVTNKQKTGFDIKLSKDLKGLTSAEIGNVSISNNITVGTGDKKTVITDNSVTTGNTTINNDGLTIKMKIRRRTSRFKRVTSTWAATPFTTSEKRRKRMTPSTKLS